MFVYELGIWQSPSRGDRMNPDVMDHDVTRDCKSSKSLFWVIDGLDTFVDYLTSLVERVITSLFTL